MTALFRVFIEHPSYIKSYKNKLFGTRKKFTYYLDFTAQIWGNLISSLVFKTTTNKTITDEDLLSCGANFCPGSTGNNTNLDKPSMEKVILTCLSSLDLFINYNTSIRVQVHFKVLVRLVYKF